MHILMISIDSSIAQAGSAAQARMEQYGSLVDGGIDIILLGTSFTTPIMLKNKVIVHSTASMHKFISAIKAVSLARTLARTDTVISVQDPFELGMIGILASWITSKPLNVQVHIDFFSPYFSKESVRQRFQSMIAPFVLKHASSVRVVSQKIAIYLRDHVGIPVENIVIAPVFVDAHKVQEVPVTIDLHKQYPEFEKIILVASRFVPQKNIPLAVEAFDIFRKKYPRYGMVIVGSGAQESVIRTAIETRGLGASIKIAGWTREFISCMKTCDMFVLSSDYEGWGMTVIEAASLAKPIIMTRVGCADEFLQHKGSGLIVPVRDPVQLALAMERYAMDPAFAGHMSKKASEDALIYMTQSESDSLQKKAWERAIHSV